MNDGDPVVGPINLPLLGERYLGWKGGGCRRRTDAGTEEEVPRQFSRAPPEASVHPV
jgi:hypothetical protein